jgi:hypothetical protein
MHPFAPRHHADQGDRIRSAGTGVAATVLAATAPRPNPPTNPTTTPARIVDHDHHPQRAPLHAEKARTTPTGGARTGSSTRTHKSEPARPRRPSRLRRPLPAAPTRPHRVTPRPSQSRNSTGARPQRLERCRANRAGVAMTGRDRWCFDPVLPDPERVGVTTVAAFRHRNGSPGSPLSV